jgi:hypothetical protein
MKLNPLVDCLRDDSDRWLGSNSDYWQSV